MSSYETYISASARPETQHRIDPYFHIPSYAAPDLDPSGPLPEALAHNGGHHSSDDTYENHQNNHRTSMSGDENGAGPSRKRARPSDPSNGHNGASHNGYNGGHSSGSHNGHNGHAPAQAAGGPSKLPVPASIFGFDARNDLLREIATWLTNTCRGRENIEIEIKLGMLLYRATPPAGEQPRRIQLPGVLSEKTVYANQHMFSSDMMPSQHKELNKVLNGLVTNPPDPSNRLRYKRIKQVDTFYQVNGRKVRVSSLAETGEVTDVIQKEKVDHLDIFCPAQNLDLRISVNTETPAEMPEGEPIMVRTKDRISYSHSVCQTDLTWVTGPGPDGVTKSSFEVEVEVVDVENFLMDSERNPTLFDQKLTCCMDTARILVRNATPDKPNA